MSEDETLNAVTLYFVALDSGSAVVAKSECGLNDLAGALPMPNVAFSGRYRTDKILIPATATQVIVRVLVTVASGGSATVRVGNAIVKKVIGTLI